MHYSTRIPKKSKEIYDENLMDRLSNSTLFAPSSTPDPISAPYHFLSAGSDKNHAGDSTWWSTKLDDFHFTER